MGGVFSGTPTSRDILGNTEFFCVDDDINTLRGDPYTTTTFKHTAPHITVDRKKAPPSSAQVVEGEALFRVPGIGFGMKVAFEGDLTFLEMLWPVHEEFGIVAVDKSACQRIPFDMCVVDVVVPCPPPLITSYLGSYSLPNDTSVLFLDDTSILMGGLPPGLQQVINLCYARQIIKS